MKKFYLSSVKITVLSLKSSTTIRLLLLVLFVSLFSNVVNAQTCNGSSGTVYSNTDTMCVGSATEQFWSTGWSGSGASWSSSNPAILKVVQNSYNGNATVTAIASGTADVIYTYKESGCTNKTSKKTITVGSVVGAVSANQSICTGSFLKSNITIASATGTIQWKRADNAAFTSNVTNVGTNSKSLTIAQVGALTTTKYFRAVVTGGTCGTGTSAIVTVTVSPTSVGGKVDYATTPICMNTATTLNLSGSTGSILQWEKRVNSGSWTIIDNTTSILNETPSSSGDWEYRALVGNGSCASVYSASRVVTVNTNLSASVTIAASPSGAICSGTSVTFTATPTNGGTTPKYQWYKGTTAISGATSASYTSTTLENNDIIKVVLTSNAISCSAVTPVSSGSITMNVKTIPATPTLGNSTQPDCTIATGSIVLSGLPASGTISQTGTVVSSYAITASTMTISGLIEGTYNFSVKTGTCSSSLSENVVINGVVTNTWNGTTWSKGTPNSTQKIVFAGDYDSTDKNNVDLVGCSCKITGGKKVTIKSGLTLTINNGVTVEESGSLIFEDTASLIQSNPAAVNKGNITYKRFISSVLTSDYTYWSSPVENQNLIISQFYKSGMFFSYDDFATPENWKPETASTIMQIGKGYIIRGSQSTLLLPPPPGLYDATFVGVPNNGTKTIAIGSIGTSNLLGNPYPSAINADAFLATNSTLVEGTIYFWTHNTAIQLSSNITNGKAGSGAYAYTSDDYASYNTTGGVGTGNFGSKTEVIANRPTGKIAAGQAFFTTSKAKNASVTFNNNMRVSGSNTQFFKTKASNAKTANTIEKSRIWLNLSNDQGAFKQTLVGYVTDATNEYDSRFDGESFDGNEFVDFYSVNNDMNLVIQGRALPFDENDTVPLGFKSTIEGDFTINIDETDGLLTNQTIFIEDKLTNTVFDLKSGDYTFKTTAGTFNDRFVLRYNSKTLGVDETDKEDGILVLYSKNYKTLIIYNKEMDSTVDLISLYNMAGQKIAAWDVKDKDQSDIHIPIKDISSEIYVVKVKTTKGEISKKIIVN